MADQGDVLTDLDGMTGNGNGNGADTQPTAGFVTQYIKDLSVENPNAPQAFQWQDQPQIDVQFNMGSTQVNDELFESELKITVTAIAEQGKVYIVELVYGALIGIRNLPEEQAHMFRFAEAPRIMFPFARRIIADAVRDLGYQPLMLDPIDFNGFYMQRLAQKQQEEAAAAGSAPN